jgi:hypothetical protein
LCRSFTCGADAIRIGVAGDNRGAGDILPGFRTAVTPFFPPISQV